MPCKELALKFQRGDILHVINTSDDNWWQAYREGDDMFQSLAGLIPSSSFQQQYEIHFLNQGDDSRVIAYNREMERQTIPTKEKDLFGCAKKQNGKQKTKKGGELKPLDEIFQEKNEAGKLLNSNFNLCSEILTYEDVALYLSRTGRKRPIVLCGPEGVGCLELRQKLMTSNKEKFANAVPRSSIFSLSKLFSLQTRVERDDPENKTAFIITLLPSSVFKKMCAWDDSLSGASTRSTTMAPR